MMMSSIEKLKSQKTPIKDPITQPRLAKWRGLSLGRHRCTVCNSPFCVRVTRESAFRSLFESVWLFSQGREKPARNSNKCPFTTRDSAVRCYVFSRAPDGGASKIARGTPTRRRARAPRSVSALRVSARVSRVLVPAVVDRARALGSRRAFKVSPRPSPRFFPGHRNVCPVRLHRGPVRGPFRRSARVGSRSHRPCGSRARRRSLVRARRRRARTRGHRPP